MKTAIALLAISTVVVTSVARGSNLESSPPLDTTIPLFTIQRTENANELNYEARLTPGGLDTKNPIKVYWVMKAEDGHLEDLNELEKQMAYGVAVEKATPTEATFTLRAFKGRKIVVRLEGEAGAYRARAFTPINDEVMPLDRLFITTASLGLFPKVRKVEIFGKALADGTLETETLVP